MVKHLRGQLPNNPPSDILIFTRECGESSLAVMDASTRVRAAMISPRRRRTSHMTATSSIGERKKEWLFAAHQRLAHSSRGARAATLP